MKFYHYALVLLPFLLAISGASAQENTQNHFGSKLTHKMSDEEKSRQAEIGKSFIQTDPPTGAITSIAEFERASGVLVAYPFGIPLSLVREMAQNEIVTTLVPNAAAETTVRNLYTQARVNLSNCRFMHIETDSYWTRDFGPMYITYGENQIGIVDFPYNRPRPLDDDAPRTLAEDLDIPWFGMPVVHTGGNYMTDGYGYAASTTIAYTENPTITPAEVDLRMQNYLGIDDYSVLEDPNNTYIDHIDCWGKYLAPNKVLIRSVPTSHPQYDEIEATAAYFANKTSMYGTPYKVYRVFTPQNQPYTNSYILNNKVFVPIMNSQYDDEALQAYRDAMPGYEVIGILGQSSTPWESTDALHCRTHEMADLGMLNVKHMPLLGNQPAIGSYNISATVTPFSGENIINDSVLLHYRINANPVTPFSTITMTPGTGTNFTAILPASETGSTMEYYLSAKDASGRKEYHPFIGSPDPHTFYAGTKRYATASVQPASLELTAMKDTRDTTMLTINSTGQIGVHYTLRMATDINDTLSYTLANSPSATAYNSNTLTESGWTSLNVDVPGQVGALILQYNWNTDDYHTEGSVWIESPAGTSIMVASGQRDGTYRMLNNNFAGETLNGQWKIWIQDSRGDGGHQATGIILKLVKYQQQDSWLTVSSNDGIIPKNTSADISVYADATNLAIGTYQGKLTVYTNDTANAAVEIPVTLNVTINTPVYRNELPEGTIAVSPNPFIDKLVVEVDLPGTENISLELINVEGISVVKHQQTVSGGKQQIMLSATGLKQGVYMLKVTAGASQQTFKLVKAN